MKVIRKPGEGAKRLAFLLKALKTTKCVKVGYFKSAKYPNGTPVAYVATIQEYGDPSHNIPPRPTMRPAVAHNRNNWRAIARDGAKQMLSGDLTVDQVLDRLGSVAAGNIKEEIINKISPPLKESTLRARARQYADKSKPPSNKPLVGYHKLLLNSVTHVKEERGR